MPDLKVDICLEEVYLIGFTVGEGPSMVLSLLVFKNSMGCSLRFHQPFIASFHSFGDDCQVIFWEGKYVWSVSFWKVSTMLLALENFKTFWQVFAGA